MTNTVLKVVYSDIHHSFSQDTQGRVRIAYNEEAVGSALFNILATNQNERVMLPEFGADLRGFLFERINNQLLKKIADKVQWQISRWDPRIKIVSLNLVPDADALLVELNVTFSFQGSLLQLSVKTS